jgi:hypothetical protein
MKLTDDNEKKKKVLRITVAALERRKKEVE